MRRPGSTENVGHGWHHRAANLEAREADCSCALLSLAEGGPAGRCGVLSDLSKLPPRMILQRKVLLGGTGVRIGESA